MITSEQCDVSCHAISLDNCLDFCKNHIYRPVAACTRSRGSNDANDDVTIFEIFFKENRKPPQDDYYTRYHQLQREIEFYDVQEEYIKDEMRNLRKEYLHAQEEVKRIQSIPLVIGHSVAKASCMLNTCLVVSSAAV